MSKCYTSTLVCPDCGSLFPISRPMSEKREWNHKKKLYCITCKKEVNMVEKHESWGKFKTLAEREENGGV